MTEALHDIATAIKAGRIAKNLTQRELGERVGIPQSHLSKIEKGSVDLKLSSLVEIARALDLEFKLVPRQALPAVESSVRAHDAGRESRRAAATLREQTHLAETIRAHYPAIPELEDFQKTIRNISRLQLGPAQIKDLELALRPTRQINALIEAQGGAQTIARRIREATAALQTFRNIQAHQPLLPQGRSRPAYRLDEEEE